MIRFYVGGKFRKTISVCEYTFCMTEAGATHTSGFARAQCMGLSKKGFHAKQFNPGPSLSCQKGLTLILFVKSEDKVDNPAMPVVLHNTHYMCQHSTTCLWS